ncbi:HemK methyltransferase member 2 [Dermatophagoides pteronyssinus]|uniref:HemK methyltransferase member 2 n=1 Tax=Dermatophagoides pteronyssinus TaxID=6956 RepID=A0ABQ8JGX7_DERPT|nr:HemK methyltransferase member 2 [Dermatophagoides pteronyssinus]
MMETPKLPLEKFGHYFQNVYEPAEDTFLLIDALEQDIETIIRLKPLICLEIGTGSGSVITSLAKKLGPNKCFYLATDLNGEALECSRKCFEYNTLIDNLHPIRCNLSQAFRSDLLSDLIVFNPPYVPTDSNESLESSDIIAAAWAGGKDGRQIIDRFIDETLVNHLNRPNGLAYLVALEQNRIDDIIHRAKQNNFKCQRILTRRCGIEKLSILKFEYKF